MMDSNCKTVTAGDAAIVEYLRKRVDQLQDERFRLDTRPTIENELKVAIRDLREYTSKLRADGYNI